MSGETDSVGKTILKFHPPKKDGGVKEFERCRPSIDRFAEKIEKGLKVSNKSMKKEFKI